MSALRAREPVVITLTEAEFTETETPHALYRLYDASGVLLYVGITWNLPGRMVGHARKPWWPEVARRTMVWYPSEQDARTAEAAAIDAENPLHNDVRPVVSATAPPHGQRRGWNRTPLIGWHSEDPTLKRWIDEQAACAGVTVREYFDRLLAEHRKQVEQQTKKEEKE